MEPECPIDDNSLRQLKHLIKPCSESIDYGVNIYREVQNFVYLNLKQF